MPMKGTSAASRTSASVVSPVTANRPLVPSRNQSIGSVAVSRSRSRQAWAAASTTSLLP